MVYETKSTNRTQLFDVNTTIYAIFDKSGAAFLDFCYDYTSSDYIANIADQSVYCECSNLSTITVYFNENDYNTYGFENITWYKDSNLTLTVDSGYYTLSNIIYRLVGGGATPIKFGTCPPDSSELICTA